MQLRSLSLAIVLLTAASACRTERKAPAKAEPGASAGPAGEQRGAPSVARFGEPISAGENVRLSTLLAQPRSYSDKRVIVEAEVRRACSRRGCWMEIAESTDKAVPGCRVTFKDYGFFVPTDSAGAHARLQGSVVVEAVAADYVQHLEQEGARFEHKNSDGTADEVRIVATGVELTKKL